MRVLSSRKGMQLSDVEKPMVTKYCGLSKEVKGIAKVLWNMRVLSSRKGMQLSDDEKPMVTKYCGLSKIACDA
jgi:hypothetical protein